MEQLLTTKLHIPPTRPQLVLRPRLVKRLNDGLGCKLTLLSAPAGFGKTTLVSEWLDDFRLAAANEDHAANRIAWFSLDEGDNDLVRFLAYFITALKQASGMQSVIGVGALEMLQSPQPPPAETVLTSLLNEVAAIPDRIILVLDDYHVIEIQPIHEALTFLLEHSPQQLHLVIATREDPHIPLARLRARCHMTELRAADLRFTPSEAAEFLNQVMGLGLTAEDIAALEDRTEGWIVGLQLAAVSLQGQADKSRLIRSFTGSNRFVLDYLVEDVLSQQPRGLQDFLVQTSILKRLSGPLCDALTGQENGQAALEMLDHANLFIVPLDNERRWYRYHNLFADLLRRRLHQTQPEQQPILHLRASEWYEQNGFTEQAIEHSLGAEDFNRAATLAEQAWPEMHSSYKGVNWLRWVKAIPDELVRARPVLSTGYGWSLIDTGDLEGADLHLTDAEQWLDARANMAEYPEGSSLKQVKLDEQAVRSLSASIANARAYLTQALGDVTATEKYTQRALDLLPENDYFERGLSSILQGFAYWSSGNLEAAHRAISAAISNMQMLGKIRFIISFTSYLADIMIAQGRLNETKKTYLQLLDTAVEQGGPELIEMAVVYLGLSELYHEQGDLQAARRYLLSSEALGKLPAFPPWYRHWVLAQVRIKEAEADLEAVFEILNEADRLYYRHPIPDVRPLSALIARAQLVEGRLAEALLWVDERGLSVEDELSYLREFEHLTLARILIAQYKSGHQDGLIHDTIGLLERLLKAAQEGGRVGSVIEIMLLQALAYKAKGDIRRALISLEHALELAEPEGYLRLFVDEGPPMALLLYEALARDISPAYVHRLLAAFPVTKPKMPVPAQAQSPDFGLIEPLSEREIEVLRLIADGLTNPEIATRLFLSPHTIKAHTRNIFSKLNVHNRQQAIARSQALGILSLREL
jgi:LuxR family transcriptional regulator, maltose regulon positive regulatory protein